MPRYEALCVRTCKVSPRIAPLRDREFALDPRCGVKQSRPNDDYFRPPMSGTVPVESVVAAALTGHKLYRLSR